MMNREAGKKTSVRIDDSITCYFGFYDASNVSIYYIKTQNKAYAISASFERFTCIQEFQQKIAMTMGSIKFSEKILINSNSSSIFDYTQDYNNRLVWDTFLIKADIIDGAEKAGLGVKTYCVAKNGIGMETEYVSFNRPKVTAVKMINGPYMFKSFLGSWRFKELEEQLTEVTFLYALRLRFPFNIASRFITNNLRNNVKQRLADLKSNIEHTTIVDN